jgi:hypothetical protein
MAPHLRSIQAGAPFVFHHATRQQEVGVLSNVVTRPMRKSSTRERGFSIKGIWPENSNVGKRNTTSVGHILRSEEKLPLSEFTNSFNHPNL